MFFNDEIQILKRYKTFNPVSFIDYMIDYILMNPFSYPVTSYIMKSVTTKGKTLHEILTRDKIYNCITKYNSVLIELSNLMVADNDTGFNLLAVNCLRKTIMFQIIQTDPFILLIYDTSYPEYCLLINDNFDNFTVFKFKDYTKIIKEFYSKKIKTIRDFIENTSVSVYDFKLDKEKSIDTDNKRLMIINFISHRSIFKISSDFDFNDCNTEFCKNIISKYTYNYNFSNIFEMMIQDSETYSPFLKIKNSEKSFHINEVFKSKNNIFEIRMQ